MELEHLDHELFALTASERMHLQDPDVISERYSRMDYRVIDGEKLYLFHFHSLLKGRNICLMKESRFAPIPPHFHSTIEINYVYSGHCEQTINGRNIRLEQGDICLLDTNTVHSMERLGQNDIVITIDMRKSYFTANFLSRLSSQSLLSRFLANALSENTATKQYLTFQNNKSSHLHLLIQQLLCEYYGDQICRSENIDAYMILLFSEMLRIYRNDEKSVCRQTKDGNLLISILQYMEQNYRSISLKSTAAHFGMHPNYLSSYIHKYSGCTFKELIISQKMMMASFYLINSHMPISEICTDVGYSNMGFFYSKFEKFYNMTPQAFRSLHNYNRR